MNTLISIFPEAKDLLALDPEELAGVILEVVPSAMQNGRFSIGDLLASAFPPVGPSYGHGHHRAVELAMAEALSWLNSQGLIVRDPGQPAAWYVVTRRGQALRTRADVEVFRKGRALPTHLLQPGLSDKVWPLFLRGDHDIAVFQAFKQVEVEVRRAGGYPDELVGVQLMRTAFHPEDGNLTAKSVVKAEREAVMHLFAGAIGHAKNPNGHREVGLGLQAAARLIILASHLLDIVENQKS